MDGEFHTQLCAELERGEENSSLHQHTNLLHGSFLLRLLQVCQAFEALEAPYFCREAVLKNPRRRHTNDKAALVPEEFIAK
jgi:hypothetical protein